jgi:hypothetical protein
MKLLSIDVGMKCLAYCLFSIDGEKCIIEKWGVLDLCNEKNYKCCGKTKKNNNCDKNAKYHKNDKYYCKIHAKKQNYKIPTNELKHKYINKIKLCELKKLCDKYDIIVDKNEKKKFKKADYQNIILEELNAFYLEFVTTVKAHSINLTTYGRRLKVGFENLLDNYDIDRIIIENQIGPLALRMKSLQGMIMQHFIEKNCQNIEEISAANKLKDYITKKKTTYSERKKLSISVTQSLLLDNPCYSNWVELFLKHKKKDDLADSFLQGLWYIKYKL